MVKGKSVDTRAPEAAARAMPVAKARARTVVEDIPINSAASRLSATARIALPGRVRYRNNSRAKAMMTAAAAAAMWFPVKVYSPTVKPGTLKFTLYGLVLQMAVPAPMMIMFTAKVESRLDNCGRPMTQCTDVQYTSVPNTRPIAIIGSNRRERLTCRAWNMMYMPNMPSAITAPGVRLMTPMTPQMRLNPIAASPYTEPMSRPSIMDATIPAISHPCAHFSALK